MIRKTNADAIGQKPPANFDPTLYPTNIDSNGTIQIRTAETITLPVSDSKTT